MRAPVTKDKIKEFISKLANDAKSPGGVYFCGGTTALLYDIRNQTVDIDLKFDPEPKGVFEAISALKKKLDINIELASPDDFIPASDDWKTESVLIDSIKGVDFYHYDLNLQALAKIERGHQQDLKDVASFLSLKLITKDSLNAKFEKIKVLLIRYPAVNQENFQRKLNDFLSKIKE